jgi:hypothetical protein
VSGTSQRGRRRRKEKTRFGQLIRQMSWSSRTAQLNNLLKFQHLIQSLSRPHHLKRFVRELDESAGPLDGIETTSATDR